MSLIGGLLVSSLGALLAVAGVRRLLTAVSLFRSAATPVGDVARTDGPVEFAGLARPGPDHGAFEAPFSGEEALCCELWMRTKDRHRTDVEGLEVGDARPPETHRNTEQSWLLAETGDLRRPFVVEDGGHRVLVDPEGADLDVTGHMGETVLTVDAGEPVPEAVRERLDALGETAPVFDGSIDRWTREDDAVSYREARLEPGDPVHVVDATVERVSEEWGSGITAVVGAPDGDYRYLISKGTESSVVRRNVVQFVTGTVVGLILVALGLYALEVVTIG